MSAPTWRRCTRCGVCRPPEALKADVSPAVEARSVCRDVAWCLRAAELLALAGLKPNGVPHGGTAHE